jgi:hypothetical protein
LTALLTRRNNTEFNDVPHLDPVATPADATGVGATMGLDGAL